MDSENVDIKAASPSGRASSVPSQMSTNSTAGEEVMTTLYQKACADRDRLANTNAMYSKMLEACAEQNGIAERAAAAAKEEAERCRNRMNEANAERDRAVIKMQRNEAESTVQLQQLEATNADTVNKLAGQLNEATEAIASAESRYMERTAAVADRNKVLSASQTLRTVEAAMLPRSIALAKNQTKQEMMAELSRVSEMVLGNQREVARLVSSNLKEVTRIESEKEALAAEVTNLRAELAAAQKAVTAAESDGAARVQGLNQRVLELEAALRDSNERADAVTLERDGLVLEVEEKIRERETTFEAEVHRIESENAAKEEALLQKLNELTQAYADEKKANQAEKANLWQRAQDSADELAAIKRELYNARRGAAGATRARNDAVRDTVSSFEAELNDANEAVKQARDALSAQLQENADQARRHADELASREALDFPNPQLVRESDETVVELRSQIATLTASVTELQRAGAEAVQASVRASSDADAAAKSVDEAKAIAAQHTESALVAERKRAAAEVQAVTNQAAEQSNTALERARELQQTVEANAEQVLAADELAAAARNADERVHQLREELRAVRQQQQGQETPEGGLSVKRKRK